MQTSAKNSNISLDFLYLFLQIMYSQLYTEDQARDIAKKIFENYDRNRNGQLDDFEIGSMMIYNYKGMGKQFSPAANDLQLYKDVLDTDGDGQVGLADFENLCIRYFCKSGGPPQQYKPVTSNHIKSSKNLKASVRIYLPEIQAANGRQYTQRAQERLEMARTQFEKFDTDGSGYIEEHEVRGLLIETYRSMNMIYNPTEADVKAWMQLTDANGDGKVTLDEFQAVVIKSLLHSGVQVYE